MAYAVSILAGLGLGGFFFGGLWWTVRRLPTARHPAALALGSFFVRTTITAGGLFLAADGRLGPLAAGLAALVLVRTVLVRRIRPNGDERAGEPRVWAPWAKEA